MVKRPLRRGQYQRGYLKLRSRSVLTRASPTKEGRNERVQGDEQDILNKAPSNGRPRSRTREQSRTRTWQGTPDPCPQTSLSHNARNSALPWRILVQGDPLAMRKESTMLSVPWASAGRAVVRSRKPVHWRSVGTGPIHLICKPRREALRTLCVPKPWWLAKEFCVRGSESENLGLETPLNAEDDSDAATCFSVL